MFELTNDQKHLLEWLSQEDTSQYGECYGASLDRLLELGLAFLHGEESELYNSFIAKRRGTKPDIMFRAVSLTAAGYKLAAELRSGAI